MTVLNIDCRYENHKISSCSKRTFCGKNTALCSADCYVQRVSCSLKQGFRFMVRICSVLNAGMKRKACMKSKSAEKFFRHAGIITADSFLLKIRMKHQKRPAADVCRSKSKRFIHRGKETAETHNTGTIAQCFPKCITQNNTRIFHRVVTIYIKVTAGFQR